ncbi:MAG: aldehyde ferredoxin oxidoreductase family protein [Anaerolineae bacterium]|jgi:aldehyde:ferredoxin oxidoreductase
MPYGYCGKILKVDLTTGEIGVDTPPEDFYRRYGGGSCLAMTYMLREMPPGLDPLDPRSLLIFAASVVTGAPLSGLSRFNVTAKSPLMSTIGDSQGGGFWGAELKMAGFDAVVITGRAEEPVYLWIQDGTAHIRPAVHLWGLDTGPAQAQIREELGDGRIRVAQIGLGGENLVRYAAIVNELHHFNGRTGMGAVMGAKHLKAIAVRGHSKVEVHDPATLLALARSVPERIAESGGSQILQTRGTAGFLEAMSAGGGLPTRNFRSGVFEGAGAIGGEAMYQAFHATTTTCYACAVRCKQVVAAEEPYEIDPQYGGPEYEGLAALGAYTGVSDLAAVCKANELCNRYTLDVITCGATIAWAVDCYERGVIGRKETGGLELRFGDGAVLVQLVELIARREGIGDLLAAGPLEAAKAWGPDAEDLLVHTKGHPYPAHMARAKGSLPVVYAVNAYGADHMCTEHDAFLLEDLPEALRERMRALGILETAPVEATGPAKMRLAAISQRFMSLLDSLELCAFCFASAWFFDTQDLVTTVRAVTGWRTNLWELMLIGERRINLMRAFNAREGLAAADDRLPPRMVEPLEGGPTDGWRVDLEAWQLDRALYYGMMGWDPERGLPTRAKLYELELDWVVEELDGAAGA